LPLKEKYLADELEKFREQAANKARRDRLDEEKGLQRSYLREEILGFGARYCRPTPFHRRAEPQASSREFYYLTLLIAVSAPHCAGTRANRQGRHSR
jgi:hypothetical protein